MSRRNDPNPDEISEAHADLRIGMVRLRMIHTGLLHEILSATDNYEPVSKFSLPPEVAERLGRQLLNAADTIRKNAK